MSQTPSESPQKGGNGWVTAFFLHEHPGHLVVMVAMLLFFGVALETVAGARHTIPGLPRRGAGSASVMIAAAFVDAGDLMVGPSAGVFAIAAAFAALRLDAKLRGRKAKTWAAALLVFKLPFALAWPLGSLAHVAGLGVGAAIGYRLRTAAAEEQASVWSAGSVTWLKGLGEPGAAEEARRWMRPEQCAEER